MNLFSDYQKKIFNSLKKLEKKKLIQISSQLIRFTVELPPQNQKCRRELVVSDDSLDPSGRPSAAFLELSAI